MPISLTETATLVGDVTFKRRTTAAFVRRAGLYLQQSDAQLNTAFPSWTAAGVRDAAADIVRSSNRDEMQTRLAYLICAVPAMSADATDATIESSATTAFPSLINPGARNP